ncbi:MAG: hypothetical protein H6765_05475 [Candidatus Peribacteria bacterium]|nr:MAG: hypothetical protein H6765_05475 [Candidatus Peribacteria bacterium]
MEPLILFLYKNNFLRFVRFQILEGIYHTKFFCAKEIIATEPLAQETPYQLQAAEFSNHQLLLVQLSPLVAIYKSTKARHSSMLISVTSSQADKRHSSVHSVTSQDSANFFSLPAAASGFSANHAASSFSASANTLATS